MRRLVIALLASTFAASVASANAPEDMFGTSARVTAMGGAGTAVARDGYAAYYNPAALARCPDNQVSVDVRHIGYDLAVHRIGADAPADGIGNMHDPTRVSLGACLLLPYHFSAGITFSTGLEQQATIRLPTGSNRPNFPFYGQPLEHINVNAALAYRPMRQLSIGVGASVLAGLDLPIIADVPVGQLDANSNFIDLTFRITAHVAPRIAPYVGVLIEPSRKLRIGVSYRGRISLGYHSALAISTVFLDWTVPVPIVLRGEAWYSPHQVAVAVAGEPVPNLTLTFDTTWYGYGEQRHSSFPYLNVSTIPGSMGSVLPLVGVPNPDPPDFHAAFAFRMGAEGRVLASRRLALRGGYALRTSALPTPGARNTTLLDGVTHSFTVGGGYAFNVRWDDSDDEHDRPPAPTSPPGARPSAPANADADEHEADADERTLMTARVDAYARMTLMPFQTDAIKDIRYGGHLFDAGLTLTLGWR